VLIDHQSSSDTNDQPSSSDTNDQPSSSDTTGIPGGSDALVTMSASGAGGGVPRPVTTSDGTTLILTGSIAGIVTSATSITQDQPLVLFDQPNNGCVIAKVTGQTPPSTLALSVAPASPASIVLPLGNLNSATTQFQLLGVDPASETLVRYDLLQGSNPSTATTSTAAQALQPLVGNVLAMQALYGIADNNG
jgi:hypothetical protein